jgi:hypothetical protein
MNASTTNKPVFARVPERDIGYSPEAALPGPATC